MSDEEEAVPRGFALGYYDGWADAKAGRSYGEGPFGTRPVDHDHQPICGVVSLSGVRGAPLACGLPVGHSGTHAWASLPTFTEDLQSEIDAAASVAAYERNPR